MSHNLREKSDDSSRERGNSWTDDDVRILITLWGLGKSNADIAKKLSRNENAVAIKASRLHLPPKNATMAQGVKKPNGAKIRNCLCCTRPFFSEGIGNRICDPCKGSSAYSGGDFAVHTGGHR